MALYKVEICGVNTAKLPLLSEKEKAALFERIKRGDEKAREEYINGNLRLVLSIVQRFSNSEENMDDLFQIGCIGLMKAVDNFDESHNVKFSTYAVPMIIGEVRRYLRDNNSIRVSRSVRDTAYKAIYAREKMMKQKSLEPTVNEVAEEIGVTPEDVVFALDAIQSPVSLYDPIYDQGGDTLYVMDQVKDKNNSEDKWIDSIALADAMRKLQGREREIIEMRYFSGKTQMEVAGELNISQAQVSRLEKNALKTMRKYLEGNI
ncbi:MAG: RNA polymerase sporulation sigma factor SigG [Lachnospiraceae bacterium]|nr:RNA polymerase sporulation sigma factor SigG [Lachnospiraceae bacterium]